MILRILDGILCGMLIGEFVLFTELPPLLRCFLLGLAIGMVPLMMGKHE